MKHLHYALSQKKNPEWILGVGVLKGEYKIEEDLYLKYSREYGYTVHHRFTLNDNVNMVKAIFNTCLFPLN